MSPVYAVVAYVRSPVGVFVERLHRDLHPENRALPAHVTILPPRYLSGTEQEARSHIERICREVMPFEVTMGDVETFAPVSPTVFIRVAHAGYRLRELHDKLNANGLACDEPWPYMPHLTIVKLSDPDDARRAAEFSKQRWAQFTDTRRILIDELTFVRSGETEDSWIDLAPIRLGRQLAEQPR